MSTEQKIDLLTSPVWSLKDLMDYTGIKSRTTAIKLKKRAFLEKDGIVPYGNQYVKRDAILEILGTNYKKELEVLNAIQISKV